MCVAVSVCRCCRDKGRQEDTTAVELLFSWVLCIVSVQYQQFQHRRVWCGCTGCRASSVSGHPVLGGNGPRGREEFRVFRVEGFGFWALGVVFGFGVSGLGLGFWGVKVRGGVAKRGTIRAP